MNNLIRNTLIIFLCADTCGSVHADTIAAVPLSGDVTLSDCIARALTQSPRLEGFAWGVRAAEAAQLQARARPNPYLSLEVEDVRWHGGPGTTTTTTSYDRTPGSLAIDAGGGQGGTTVTPAFPSRTAAMGRTHDEGAHSGFGESDFTLRLSQVIELGGKRARRITLAARERDVAAWDYERARADLCAEVAQAFVAVLASQRRVTLAEELMHLAQETQRTVDARVAAGKVSPIETERARIPVSQAKSEEETARGALESARAQLAGFCGDDTAQFDKAVGDLDATVIPPPLPELIDRIVRNPDLSRWTAEIDARDAAIDSERAKAKPDVTLTLGVRTTPLQTHHTREWTFDTDGVLSANRSQAVPGADFDTRLVFEVGVPLPVFDRNRGTIEQAEDLASKARAERTDSVVRMRADITKAYYDVASTLTALNRISREILPAAKEAFEKTEIGYREGKFGYADVIESERTLFDAQRSYLDVQQSYHTAEIALDRLTGGGIPGDAPVAPEGLSPSNGAAP